MEQVKTKTTLAFIEYAHGGQLYGNKPYFLHPLDVAEFGRKQFGQEFDSAAYTVALLHDVVEDTVYSLEDLRLLGYSSDILVAVDLVTKDKNLTYEENISKIIDSGDRRAMMVKFSDNYMNYTGDKSDWDPKKAAKSQAKYMKSMNLLAIALQITFEV